MTYKELMNYIFEMTPEQQNKPVTILLDKNDSLHPIRELWFNESRPELEKEHPYFAIRG